MPTDDSPLRRLTPLLGEWDMETSFAPPGAVRARATFEWALGDAFLIQRTEIDLAEAPDSLCVIAADPRTGGFTQHYFDSRGVVRVYAMTFDGRTWTLRREAPDFSPLDFAQRYAGVLSDDGGRIEGRWESRPPDAGDWALDFELTYVRRR
jgi:hypothetical protein